MARTAAPKSKTSKPTTPTNAPPAPPWERAGTERRFEGHRIALGGKLSALRKDELVSVLEAEGAVVADKLDKATTILVFTASGSANHKRAIQMQQDGATLLVADEDEFRRRYLLPTADQAFEMLRTKDGRTRLASLLELNRARYSRSTNEYSQVRLERRSLRGAKLSGSSLCGVLFIECDLREADLSNVEWLAEAVSTDFRKAIATKCELVKMDECDLRECDLKETSFQGLTKCRFEGASLGKSRASGDLVGCCFDTATLDGFEAAYATLRGCSFAKASLQDAKLSDLQLEDCSFAGANLRGATCKGPVVFRNCDLRDADFRDAVLSHVRFERCDVTGARFDGATLIEVELVDTDGSKARGLDANPKAKGRAQQLVAAAAPTFKKVEVGVVLRIGTKKLECKLYQFDHGANSSCLQAWLGDENVGALQIADAIATIAKLQPTARIDEASLVVKASKGKTAPSIPPKELEKAIREAWEEALA